MRAYVILCESTKFYASLAGLAEATFYASCAKSYATTSLVSWLVMMMVVTDIIYFIAKTDQPHRE